MLLFSKIRKMNSSTVYLEQVRLLTKPTDVIAVETLQTYQFMVSYWSENIKA